MASLESSGAASYKIHVVGAARQPWLRDVYHLFLRISWPAALGLIVAAYLAVNLVFATLYLAVGGVAGAARGSLFDAFSFSVQTLGTIGYGAMYPKTRAAQTLVIVESVAGLLVTALATGLVFAKFSQPTARIAFARHVTLGLMDGVPTLMFRVGNERRNNVAEAQVRVVLMRTVKTREGVTFYRMVDVPLLRDRSPSMNRSWTVMHLLDERSPLYGATPESLARDEVEFLVTLIGVDETSYQPVHARRTYEHRAIAWGARHADVLSENANGDLVLDLGRFHEIVPTEATETFPYAWQSRGAEPVRRSPT